MSGPEELFSSPGEDATPLIWLASSEFDAWRDSQGNAVKNWLQVQRITASRRAPLWLPGDPPSVLLIAQPDDAYEPLARAVRALPEGRFELQGDPKDLETALLGWALGGYRFDRYKTEKKNQVKRPTLIAPKAADLERVNAIASAMWLARDLVNTPAADMLPSMLSQTAREIAEAAGARFEETVGDDLLEAGFGAIHGVGRASADAPRLVDITWGDPDHPRVTLVGKGVCFDSGGLDLKSAEGMRIMKKDMGGAAIALALARLVMRRKLPIRLRLLFGAVENAVSSNAYRPGDILTTYKGLTVEIGNTDAEGRLVLCDALALACEESPELLIDFATLTGAARIALGANLPAMFTSTQKLAQDFVKAGEDARDPVWQLPLHKPYASQIGSEVADLNNAGQGRYNGAIYAALFLQRFVDKTIDWAHFDLMAWSLRDRPGHPAGADAPTLRATFRYLEERFAK